jgi:hypothetical protein
MSFAPMSSQSSSLLQHLTELQQQIEDVPQCAESLRLAMDSHDLATCLGARLDAERHLCAIAVTTAHIKARVVAADQLGAQVDSLSELVLRAVRIIVLADLALLREVTSGPSACGRSVAVFRAPLDSIDAVASALGAELDRFTERWIGYRGLRRVDRAAYRTALRIAHAAMRQLGRESDAARFLREGRARTDWTALHAVCTRMLAALTVRFDLDPDLSLLVCSQPLHDRRPAESTP